LCCPHGYLLGTRSFHPCLRFECAGARLLSFGPPSLQDIPTLIVLLAVGAVISYLTSRIRKQTEEARRRELETHTLYVLSRNLAITEELEGSLLALTQSARETLGYDVSIFLPDKRNEQLLKPFNRSLENTTGEYGSSIAAWSFQHQKKAGPGTDMFPSARAHYLPLLTARGAVGVMSIPVESDVKRPTPEQERLLEAFADLAAVAIERVAFAEETRNMKLSQAATEKLQTAFVDSISHDLRTPLSSVIGVLSSLQEDPGLDDTAKINLIQVAREEAEKLNNTITNLLDISRIQAGAIQMSKQPADVGDIISVAIDRLDRRARERTININVNPEIAPVMADFGLSVKVLYNLLDNALKYSSAESTVEIGARMAGENVAIEVADRGVGIPAQDLPYIFGRFYRVPNTGLPGTGLGLSICKGIVEAHGGGITAGNRPGGGAIFTVTLPAGGPVQRRPVAASRENKNKPTRNDETLDTFFVA
jgi:two-component system sensor histidine kinase KdpD